MQRKKTDMEPRAVLEYNRRHRPDAKLVRDSDTAFKKRKAKLKVTKKSRRQNRG